jgi:antitoxin component of RelBE/YafQ-DinJ toxin-antitoxin module
MANSPSKEKRLFGARLNKDLVARFDEIANELGLTRSDTIRVHVLKSVADWLANGCQYAEEEKERIQQILDDERRIIRKAGQAKIPRRQTSGR